MTISPLTLPDGPLDWRRERWSLIELVEHWASQGARPNDVLILAWEALEHPERPDGLTIVPDREAQVAWKPADVPPEQFAWILRKGGGRGNVAHRLYLTRELAAWVVERLNGKPLAQEAPGPEAPAPRADVSDSFKKARLPSRCYDSQDELIMDGAEALIAASSSGSLTPAEAVREMAKTHPLAGSKSSNSAEKRVAAKLRKRIAERQTRADRGRTG